MSPNRQTSELRRGWLSIAGARYFLTFCTANRAIVFSRPDAMHVMLGALRELLPARDADILAATAMPDHVHMFLCLGERLSLDRVVAKLKSRVRGSLKDCAWQPNYFEHRLRDDDDAEAYAW